MADDDDSREALKAAREQGRMSDKRANEALKEMDRLAAEQAGRVQADDDRRSADDGRREADDVRRAADDDRRAADDKRRDGHGESDPPSDVQ